MTKILFLLLFMIFVPTQAWAQCAPGLPCTDDTGGYTPGDGANADKSASATCDADFMNQLHARAFMEAEREHALEARFIAKPDSVLEYTCFDQFLNHAAHDSAGLGRFSETKHWQSQNVNISTSGTQNIKLSVYMGGDNLDKAIENLVSSSLKNYQDNNFAHSFKGGNSSFDHKFSDKISPGAYSCGKMQEIWEEVTCEPITYMAFPDFADMLNYAPRNKPQQCPGTFVTLNMIDTAINYQFNAVQFDQMHSFLDRMNAPGTAPATDCGPAIPTGLIAEIRFYDVEDVGKTPVERNFVPDSVCLNPGCYYDWESQTCVQ